MFLTLTLLGGMTLLAGSALAQEKTEKTEMTRAEFEQIDSVQTAREHQQVIQAQEDGLF